MSRRRIARVLALVLACAGCAPQAAGPPVAVSPRVAAPAASLRPAPRQRPVPRPVVAPAPSAVVLGAPPDAEGPAPAVAAPMPPPAASPGVPALLRENPWLTRFWAGLDAPQRDRVARALARRGAAGEPAIAWDPLGLADRVELVFGAAR